MSLMKHIIYFCSIAFALIGGFTPAWGQHSTLNIFQQQQEAFLRQWNSSNNAAGLLLDRPTVQSFLEAGYSHAEGSYHRPQEAAKKTDAFLNTRGNIYLNRYYLEGYFSYQRSDVSGTQYNASLIDPFRGMPYLVADTNLSNWVHQDYKLGFKFSAPLRSDRWFLGMAADYQATSGAKQRDIRAENYFYSLTLRPSMVYHLNGSQSLGANLLYRSFKEESSNSNVNTYVDQKYYMLFGLGNTIDYLGQGRTMNYTGEALGAGLQYQYQGAVKFFLTADYRLQAEDAHIGFTSTRPLGTLLQENWTGRVNLQTTGGALGHVFDLALDRTDSKGIEYITEFESGLESDGYYIRYQSVRSTYRQQQAVFRYHIFKPDGHHYNWKAGIETGWQQSADRYLIPESTMDLTQLHYGAQLEKLFRLSPKRNSYLSVGFNAKFRKHVEGEYNYQGPDGEEPTVRDLEARNFAYQRANLSHFALPVTYSQRLKKRSSLQFFARAVAGYTTSDHPLLKNRSTIHISLGTTF